MSKIHIAAKQGDIETVALELAAGIDIETIGEFENCTPLMCAINSPRAGVEMVHYLIERGANVNACGGFSDENVLCMALRRGNIEVAEALLDAGAAIDYERECGYGALIDVMTGRDITRHRAILHGTSEIHLSGGCVWTRIDGEFDYVDSAFDYILELDTMIWR